MNEECIEKSIRCRVCFEWVFRNLLFLEFRDDLSYHVVFRSRGALRDGLCQGIRPGWRVRFLINHSPLSSQSVFPPKSCACPAFPFPFRHPVRGLFALPRPLIDGTSLPSPPLTPQLRRGWGRRCPEPTPGNGGPAHRRALGAHGADGAARRRPEATRRHRAGHVWAARAATGSDDGSARAGDDGGGRCGGPVRAGL